MPQGLELNQQGAEQLATEVVQAIYNASSYLVLNRLGFDVRNPQHILTPEVRQELLDHAGEMKLSDGKSLREIFGVDLEHFILMGLESVFKNEVKAGQSIHSSNISFINAAQRKAGFDTREELPVGLSAESFDDLKVQLKTILKEYGFTPHTSFEAWLAESGDGEVIDILYLFLEQLATEEVLVGEDENSFSSTIQRQFGNRASEFLLVVLKTVMMDARVAQVGQFKKQRRNLAEWKDKLFVDGRSRDKVILSLAGVFDSEVGLLTATAQFLGLIENIPDLQKSFDLSTLAIALLAAGRQDVQQDLEKLGVNASVLTQSEDLFALAQPNSALRQDSDQDDEADAGRAITHYDVETARQYLGENRTDPYVMAGVFATMMTEASHHLFVQALEKIVSQDVTVGMTIEDIDDPYLGG